MVEFCTCGSIKRDGECTNRNCVNHVGGSESATFEQMETIKSLQIEVGDEKEIDYTTLTKNQASIIIQELIMLKENGYE